MTNEGTAFGGKVDVGTGIRFALMQERFVAFIAAGVTLRFKDRTVEGRI